MMGPVGQYLQWFDAQPVEVRQFLAFEANAMFPGDLLRKGTIQESVSEFRDTLLSLVDGPFKEVGLVLTVSAFTTFGMHGKSSREDWRRVEEMNRSIAAQMSAEGEDDLAKHVGDSAEKMEFRSRLWERAAASWENARTERFNPEVLHEWLRVALAAHLSTIDR